LHKRIHGFIIPLLPGFGGCGRNSFGVLYVSGMTPLA
jgi:hypothetical protein